MPLKPLDLENVSFGRAFRGYSVDEVDSFLEKLGRDLEFLHKENRDLKEQVQNLENELQRYNRMEDTLNQTLVLAQQAAEDARQNASREIDLMFKEARQRLEESEREYNMWLEKTQQVRRRLKAFLEAEISMLDEKPSAIDLVG